LSSWRDLLDRLRNADIIDFPSTRPLRREVPDAK
jgi:hypothetical protein